MFDYAFVDFDKTIFDCARFEADIKAVFARCGVTPEDYRSTYLRSLCTVRPEEFDYSFEEQIKFLAELGYDLRGNILVELNALLQTNQYLFVDTVSFLNWLKSVAKKTILLTAGDRNFQLKKIEASGVGNYFNEAVVLNGFKEQYLKNKIKATDKVLFVNDSLRENLAVKNSFLNIMIMAKLPPGRYKARDIQASGIKYFDTLTEILNYVDQLKYRFPWPNHIYSSARKNKPVCFSLACVANKIGVVILAAGRGTRLGCVDKPKVMLEIGGRPIVSYVVETLKKIGFTKEQVVVVVGFREEAVREYFNDNVTYTTQTEQKGTAHAAYVGIGALPAGIEQVLVINGDDSAFYTGTTIQNLITQHLNSQVAVTLLAVDLENADGYSRVITETDGKIKIIEKEYLTNEQKQLHTVSTGTFVIHRAWFEKIFPALPPLRKLGEYALPAAFAVAQDHGEQVSVIKLADNTEWFGINTPEELAEANQRKL